MRGTYARYTPDFKRRVVARLANGARLCDVSRASGVPGRTILNWRAEIRAKQARAVEVSRIIAACIGGEVKT
jgi:transposase-like protein